MMLADVPRETRERLDRLTARVIEESARQNLISAASAEQFEQRHIEDSLQLLPLLPPGPLVDIGSGGGFPGMVLAICRPDPIHLVEPRRKRADFLASVVDQLGLSAHVQVHYCKVQAVSLPSVIAITARAVAPLGELFAMASHLADERTRWVLPKGRSVASELESARQSWQGDFKLVPSRTDDQAAIVVAERVARRRHR